MTLDGTRLLRSLSSGIKPAGDTSPITGPIDSARFSSLLDGVRNTVTNRPVRDDSMTDSPLNTEQIQRLGAAMDQAEASGVSRAIASIDDRFFITDIRDRIIEEEIHQPFTDASPEIIQSIDAAIITPQQEDESQTTDQDESEPQPLSRTTPLSSRRATDGLAQFHNVSIQRLLTDTNSNRIAQMQHTEYPPTNTPPRTRSI